MLVVNDGPVKVERDREAPAVAIVTLSNPGRHNAFGLGMREALLSALDDLMSEQGDCRVIVLTGDNGTFCAGGDISEMGDRSIPELRDLNRLPIRIFEMLAGGPKPVVAAVEGVAMGAGLALAAIADEVVATADVRFCAAFARVGLLPDTGLYWSLARRVGPGHARELMLTAREFDGLEALRLGLADELVERGCTLSAALVRARDFLRLAPLAISGVRSSAARDAGSLQQVVESEMNLQPLLRRTADHREAVAAFLEKRAAKFLGS